MDEDITGELDVIKEKTVNETEQKLESFTKFLLVFLKERLGVIEYERLRLRKGLNTTVFLKEDVLGYFAEFCIPRLFRATSFSKHVIEVFLYFKEASPSGLVVNKIVIRRSGNAYRPNNPGVSLLMTEEASFYIRNELSKMFNVPQDKIFL